MLKVRPAQWPSFIAMEDGAPCLRALHMGHKTFKRGGGMLVLKVAL